MASQRIIVDIANGMEQNIRQLYSHVTPEKLQEIMDFAAVKVQEWEGSNATEQPGCSNWSLEQRIANKSAAESERFIRVVWKPILIKFGKPACTSANTTQTLFVVRKKQP